MRKSLGAAFVIALLAASSGAMAATSISLSGDLEGSEGSVSMRVKVAKRDGIRVPVQLRRIRVESVPYSCHGAAPDGMASADLGSARVRLDEDSGKYVFSLSRKLDRKFAMEGTVGPRGNRVGGVASISFTIVGHNPPQLPCGGGASFVAKPG